MDKRAYGYVIIKFSRMGRLLDFFTHGTPLPIEWKKIGGKIVSKHLKVRRPWLFYKQSYL